MGINNQGIYDNEEKRNVTILTGTNKNPEN
jgi:hypothetical protein